MCRRGRAIRCRPFRPSEACRTSFHYCRKPSCLLFSAVETRSPRPDPGPQRSLQRRSRAPTKVNLASACTTNEEGKIPLLRAVREAEESPRRSRAAARLSADRRHRRLRRRRAEARCFGNDSPLIARRPRRHGAGARRHGRAEDRRRFPEAREPGARWSRSAIRAGKTTARCSKAPVSRS